MNREQAALYSKIEAQFPGALKTLLPEVPTENYRFIRAFGEGKKVKYKPYDDVGWLPIEETSLFRDDCDRYLIATQKRYCNGVELDECLQPGDVLPVYIFYPDITNGKDMFTVRTCPVDVGVGWLNWMLEQGLIYGNKESAIKHAQAMRIVEVRDE